MNGTDIIILAVIGILFAGSVWYMRKNGTCTSNCEGCSKHCARKHSTIEIPKHLPKTK